MSEINNGERILEPINNKTNNNFDDLKNHGWEIKTNSENPESNDINERLEREISSIQFESQIARNDLMNEIERTTGKKNPFKENGITFGVTEEGYEMYIENNKENNNEKGSDGFKKNIISAPAYKRGSITLCSKTARENLARLGCKVIRQGASARASFKMYGKSPESFPPKSSSTKVFDLYCDASLKNRRFGHRAVGVKINGEWYVLDPYYNKTRNPVPAATYIANMQGRGRRIWGGFSVA